MQITQFVIRFGKNDVKLVGRDSMLIGVLLFLLLIAIVLREGLPWLNSYLAEHSVLPSETINKNFSEFYPLVIAFMAIFGSASIVGFIFGFILLDEKDDKTLKAMLVTPVPFKHYLLFRIGAPAVLAFFAITAVVLWVNQAMIPLWQLIVIAAGASLAAPIVSLFLAILAENKLQGFAYGKFISLASWAIIFGWFVAEPWQWLFGVFPPFLISKAYWMAIQNEDLWWLVLIAGTVMQIGLIYWLLSVFNKIAYR
jgi:fluoroquinolone transport system permease protein